MKRLRNIFRILFICILSLGFAEAAFASGKKDKATPPSPEEKSEGREFTVEYPKYPDEFNQKMQEAFELAQNGQYLKAVHKFTRDPLTFTLKKQQYERKRKGQPEIQQVKASIERVLELEIQYSSMQAKLHSLNSGLKSSVENSLYEEANQNIQSIRENLESFSTIRNSIYDEGVKISELFKTLKSQKEINDECWLSFCEKFILGTEKTPYTGIIGALDAHWNSIDQGLLEVITEKEEELQSIIDLAMAEDSIFTPKDSYEGARKAAGEFSPLASTMKNILELKSLLAGKLSERQKKANKAMLESADLLELAGEKNLSLIDTAEKLSLLNQKHGEAEEKKTDAMQAMREGNEQTIKEYIDLANEYSSFISLAEDARKDKWLKGAKSFPKQVPRWTKSTESYEKTYSFIQNYCEKTGKEILAKAGDRLLDAGTRLYEDDQTLYEQIKILAPGLEKNLEEDESDDTPKQHPTDFIRQSDDLLKTTREDIKALESANAPFNGAGKYYKSDVQSIQKKLGEQLKKFEQFKKTLKANSEKIRNQQLEARIAINEVNMYYSRALSAYENENLATAQINLEKASKTYDSILSVMKKDADIQDQTYENLSSLKQEIVKKQRPMLISNLRDYKREIRVNYYAGNYEEANENIIRADNVRQEWETFMDTPLDADEELERFRQLVTTALTIKNGRVLNPEDPLYPEMSQILSLCDNYYTLGTSEINKGKKRDGMAHLRKAKEKLEELKLVYPHNHEATILAFKVDKILDPKAFNNTYANHLKELKQIDYSKKDATSLMGYGDLKDLQEINPAYPGLSDFIANIEINWGLREKATDDSAKEAAEEIAQEAQKALDSAGRDPEKLAEIKAAANQALSMDRTNATATAVLDEIALRTGQQAAVTLNAADEAKYQQAIRFLQNGNVVAANANLQELLQNPENLRSAKIQKLKNRIEGMLK